ncbi:MAG TPA: tetraacyldisaccharide 4'-kinase [Candidatus Binataceae bacterium]|nr:tetraacyldisaccharide 4'-kinase [Candidatus Binataceae bacterium]
MRRRLNFERLWEPGVSGLRAPLWAALTPLAALYAGALGLRAQWWRVMADSSPVATVSVGNLTLGGNGKTPFTLFLARRLRTHGHRIAIVSRGYGRDNQHGPMLVADGGKLLLPISAAGDEPAMMARAFDGPIAVARRRLDAINLLVARGPLDAIILDDAFQHRRLRRDLDLLLVGARRGFGNGWLLPAGPLREPRSAIRRADAIVEVSPAWADACTIASRDRAGLEGLPSLRATLTPHALIQASPHGWSESPLELNGRRVVAVCGLADPQGFRAMLEHLGAKIVKAFAYPDHHRYRPEDWREIVAAAPAADLVITTEKDLIKLEGFSPQPAALYAVRLKVAMDDADEARLLAMVAEVIKARRAQAASGTHPATPS